MDLQIALVQAEERGKLRIEHQPIVRTHDAGLVGVETFDQHEMVSNLGSDFCQGYYFGRPLAMASER